MPVKYVQIETTTVCNQRCVFCPVSSEKRAKQAMSHSTLEKILDGLSNFPVEAVFLNGFNEPTLDKNLLEWVEMIHAKGYQVHLNSNGSGLTALLADRLLEAGVDAVNINISTVDREKYRQTRGNDDLRRILPNLEYLLAAVSRSTTRVTLMVLGYLDDEHRKAIKGVEVRFITYSPAILICPIGNFAGAPDESFPKDIHVEELHGCSGKRTTEWLHFTPDGAAIMCCQDYYSRYVVGNIANQSVLEIYQSSKLATLRHWVDGVESAPSDFICRSCVMAVDMRERFCRSCRLASAMGAEDACGRCAVGGDGRLS